MRVSSILTVYLADLDVISHSFFFAFNLLEIMKTLTQFRFDYPGCCIKKCARAERHPCDRESLETRECEWLGLQRVIRLATPREIPSCNVPRTGYAKVPIAENINPSNYLHLTPNYRCTNRPHLPAVVNSSKTSRFLPSTSAQMGFSLFFLVLFKKLSARSKSLPFFDKENPKPRNWKNFVNYVWV